ncbi:MAG TPA: alpha-glucan family phosphorylase, partial [Casimicrobiaceae bacterium]|nr:alpha-glucan family phosphorylase [Casimicrobiaceae bacterium]
PVVFVFAGKAHPADQPGQDLIRSVMQMSRMPEFEGHLLFVENYDLRLARRLVTGVDVWLNNPVYPLEASGTSGMKAGINGVINLSVLDGWWGEGYVGDNGWAIQPAAASLEPDERDREEARTLYEIIQSNVVPLYYDRRSSGYSPEWVRMAKRSMATLIPRFSAARMLGEYVESFYRPAAAQGARYCADEAREAQAIAAWKSRVRTAWEGVRVRRVDEPRASALFGDSLPVEVAVHLNGLRPQDIAVELVLSRTLNATVQPSRYRYSFTPAASSEAAEEHRFMLQLKPELCGRLDYRIRAYPHHPLLTHPFELGLMRWA